MPTYGLRPDDVVVDAAGNVQTGATLTLHATQADAQAAVSPLATVVTSAGRWSADVATSPVWVRTPNGSVYEIQDFSDKANFVNLARNPDLIITGTVTRDANGAATSAPVTWPDGKPGTYTATTVSTDFPGAVDAYTITYGSPATKTFTQPRITRDANGAAVNVPAITVA